MSRRVSLAVLAVAAAICATRAGAQVFRCLDAAGRTTYQQTPCEAGTRGRQVELTPDNGASQDSAALEAQWTTAAKSGQVVAGMPRRHVRAAYGVPTEVRGGSASERASEVWVYRNPGGVRRVGFVDGRVAWDRGDDASSAPPSPDEAADTVSRRSGGVAAAGAGAVAPTTAVARLAIAPGQDCAAVLADAGPPDRTDRVEVPATGDDGRQLRLTAQRHRYDSDGGAPPRDVAFTCVNGVVTQVERAIR